MRVQNQARDKRYVSNQSESVRMFKSDFLEKFTHVHPSVPLILYVPLIGFMLWLTWRRDIGVAPAAGLFALGVFLWTFTEYVMHRFIFHWQPNTSWGRRLHFTIHGVHHDYPNDGSRLVMPPGLSVPLAVVFWYGWTFLFGAYAPPAFAGLLAGYLFYDMVHYATHHFPMRRGVWLKLKKYHIRHHYKDENVGYGVSSPLWDYIFGTVSR